MADENERLEKGLKADIRRLRTIEEGLSRSEREQGWHRKHTDRIKRRIDDVARALDK